MPRRVSQAGPHFPALQTCCTVPLKGILSGVTQRANGVLEKQTPHFDLALVKQLVAKHGATCFTLNALQGVQQMTLTMSEAMEAISAINQATHFYKSMSSTKFPGLWQDVYRVPTPKGDAYVKNPDYAAAGAEHRSCPRRNSIQSEVRHTL